MKQMRNGRPNRLFLWNDVDKISNKPMLTLLHSTKGQNMEVILKIIDIENLPVDIFNAHLIQLTQGDKLQIDKSSEFVSV